MDSDVATAEGLDNDTGIADALSRVHSTVQPPQVRMLLVEDAVPGPVRAVVAWTALSAIGRPAYKNPDASVNPYLSHTALMKHGIDTATELGEAEAGSSYDGHTVHAKVPLTLGDAVAAFHDNPVIRGVLAPDLAHQHAVVKIDEWARACGAVTDFDRDMYLEFL